MSTTIAVTDTNDGGSILALGSSQLGKTQKAKGIQALSDFDYAVPYYHVYRRTLEILEAATEVAFPAYSAMTFPLFARPCPKTPRHGFVDSKIVHTSRELLDLWKEAVRQDPEAEMMVMVIVKAQWNAVLTPTSFTLGRGHDGATSGRNAIVFPLMRTTEPVDDDLLEQADIDGENDPYLEAVLPYNWRQIYGGDQSDNTNSKCWELTQLRAGPKVQGESADYIPYLVPEVTQILRPDGESLLEWETRMQTVESGTVIWHKGGSLTSHYAIHAQLCGVPFVTTKKPQLGKPLPATPEKPPNRNSADVLNGVVYGDLLGRGVGAYNVRSQVTLALAGLYNSHKMRGPHSFWIGVSAAILIRLGSMALRGEARHLGKRHRSRGSVYRSYAKHPLTFHATHSREWAHIFKKGNWNNHSIGGMKWAECARGVEELVYAVRDLALEPSAATVKRLLMVLNRVVDLAHNNGWWLNKFANGEVYMKVQRGDLITLVEAGQFIPIVANIAKGLAPDRTKTLIREYQSWNPKFPKLNMRLGDPEIEKVSLAGLTVKLTAYDDILKNHRKPERVRIPASDWQDALTKMVNEKLHIDPAIDPQADSVVIRYGDRVLYKTEE
jgi:hypothetical protein